VPDENRDVEKEAVKDLYLQRLQRQIARHMRYPSVSRRRGEEGEVRLSLGISADGSIEDIVLVSSSGVTRLDEAALQTLARVGRFEPLPVLLEMQRWQISVPVVFRLR